MKINLILAVDEKNGIWKNWTIPWHIKEDLEYFKKITTQNDDLAKLNALIMWRRTWDSIPSRFRPLSDRINCILTKTIHTNDTDSKIDDFVLYFNSLEKCMQELSTKDNLDEIFIIWWASLYNELVNDKSVHKIYITKIKWDFACDTFFDWIPENFELESTSEDKKEWDYSFKFEVYKRV